MELIENFLRCLILTGVLMRGDECDFSVAVESMVLLWIVVALAQV